MYRESSATKLYPSANVKGNPTDEDLSPKKVTALPLVNNPSEGNWRIALPVLGVSLLLMIGFYWKTAASMAEIWWRSGTYAHGMLVVPIVLYMIWTRRDALVRLQPRSQPWGLGLLLFLGLGWLVAHVAQVMVIQYLVLIAMAPALVYTLLGWRVAWTIAFPLAYLFFAVPFGEDLVPPMQDFTALFTVKALQLTGIPVYQEGRYLFVPSGNWEVAEACSGVRYLIASVALGCLYAYFVYRSLWRRLAFIGLAIIFPIIANGLRAYSIIMVGHLSDMRLAVGVDHIIYGWFFFGVVMLVMFWIGSWWREPVEGGERPSSEGRLPRPSTGFTSAKGLAITAMAGLLVLTSGPLGAAWLKFESGASTPLVLQAPAAPASWSGPEEADTDGWEPKFIGASDTLHKVYYLNGRPVHLYIAYYQQQQQGAELVNSQNSLYGGPWYYLDEATRTAPLAGGGLRLNATRISSGDDKRLIWHWYWIGGHTATSPIAVKLLEAWNRLLETRHGSALVAVAADYEVQGAQAESLMRQFLDAMYPPIEAVLENRK